MIVDNNWYYCIDAYKKPLNQDEWAYCPKCGLKPLVWVFDNGRFTGCGCGESEYKHFSIHAESVCSVLKRTGGFSDYNDDELKDNWNNYCNNGDVYNGDSLKKEGKW